MNFIEKLRNIKVPSSLSRRSGEVAIIHWDRENVFYLIASSLAKGIQEKDFGVVTYSAPANPFEAIKEYFQKEAINVSRLIVLLSRPELDLLSLNLPPANADELSALVVNEVEQQLGDANEPPEVDYYAIQTGAKPPDGTTTQVLAFALSHKQLTLLQTQSSEAGFRIIAITSRHLAQLSLLRDIQPPLSEGNLSVAVHLYPGEVEMALCLGSVPILLRSIRISQESGDRVAEQIWTEFERCLTLLPQATAELPVHWYVFATNESASETVKSLESRTQEVTEIDPFASWKTDGLKPLPDRLSRISSAANAGAAKEFQQNAFQINMLAPKRPKKAPNPYRRWVGVGGLAASALGVGAYLMLSDVWQLQSDASDLDTKLVDAKKIVAKYQEKADQVVVVENWLADKIDWLAELSDLSKRLPEGPNASVRRLSAASAGTAAKIDLSVQVADQEFISQLETRIRSAKYTATSKQISQNPDSIEYPWQFETTITFPIEPPLANAFRAVEKTPKEASSTAKPEADQTPAKEDSPQETVNESKTAPSNSEEGRSL